MTNCRYEVPEDPHIKPLLEQNIKGEQCAIKGSKSLLKTVTDKDSITYNTALQILEDEVEHEEDLQVVLEDMKLLK